MAEDLIAPVQDEAKPEATPPRRRIVLDSESPENYKGRFRVIYVVLGAGLAAAVAGLVLALGSSIDGGKSSGPWSSWQPSGSGLGAAQDVAAHVAPTYKLPNGDQLVDVLTSPPQITTPNGKQTVPLQYLGVRSSGGDRVYPLSGSNTVMFRLCGLGPECSIASGTPSVARGNLVRREILELALYTFKYVPSIQGVLALPPAVPSTGTIPWIYVQKSDLSGLLDKPLADTLRAKTPTQNTIPARELATINAAIADHTFSYVSIVQSPLGGIMLVVKALKA